MTLGEGITSIFQMDDNTWERHANPWSVWSRTTVLPALILAAWSRVWIGWWAFVPATIALMCVDMVQSAPFWKTYLAGQLGFEVCSRRTHLGEA